MYIFSFGAIVTWLEKGGGKVVGCGLVALEPGNRGPARLSARSNAQL